MKDAEGPDGQPTVLGALDRDRDPGNRGASRVSYRAVVEVRVGDEVHTATVTDLSATGAFAAMADPPPVDTTIAFDLPLPAGRVPVSGRVIWCRRPGDRTLAEPGMAFRFEGCAAATLSAIGDAVTKLAQRSSPKGAGDRERA